MRRWQKILAGLAATVVTLAATGVAGGGWYLSDILRKDALLPNHTVSPPDLLVTAVGDGEVALNETPTTSKTGPWKKDGTWGLKWDGGYGHVGTIKENAPDMVVRQFKPLEGNVRVGEEARMDSFAFPGDPKQALGMEFDTVTYSSSLGAFDAWYVQGQGRTWAIFVHGRNASRREALRMLPTVVQAGFPALVIRYRNDEGAPANPDGYLRYGQSEWQDLEGAVNYALGHGAQDVVLVGYSMGGAIVANFLYKSAQADRVRAVILDAPMINFNATIDLGVRQRGYPVVVAAVAKAFAQVRFGVDWGDLNYLNRSEKLKTPILLFHGDGDTSVPVETSDALAKARPDLVTYVRVPGALHVGAWNADPAAYEGKVREFLEGVANK